MPRLTQGASERTNEDISTRTAPLLVSHTPTVICGVQRKANVGNYETIDVYAAVMLPVGGEYDQESIAQAVAEKIDEAFSIASQETYERYKLIKESIR